MPLAPGTRLGNYEITGPLGKGGMGEVYRAKDTKLAREVAVKVLPAAFAQQPESLARFEREAKVLASLNHPSIAAIYAVEESPEGKALIIELVPGETLKGPVPLETALKYAAQIADALDAAHDKGIVHRDLKPGNIMLTPDGVIKVLDFGLAAVTMPTAESAEAATLTMSPTRAGMILGTAGYMSPEQASGMAVDQRADIWSFGVVLWELLTGRRMFTGDTISHILASVLKDEPDLDAVPYQVRGIVQACLHKVAARRLGSIRDWRYLLSEEPAVAKATSKTSKLPWGIAAAIALGALALGFVHYREVPARTTRFSIVAPKDRQVESVALSPDGHTLLIATGADEKGQLWLRPMDALEAQPMTYTEGASYPFWSPDGRSIGFFANGKLKRIDAAGGPALTLADAPAARGGSWNKNGVIIFAAGLFVGLQRIPAAGGTAGPVTELDKKAGENAHRMPWFLPDGQHFLYLARNNDPAKNAVYVADVESKNPDRDRKAVLAVGSNAMYSPPGFLVFVRERVLIAQPFDAGKAEATGDAVPIAEQVSFDTLNLAGTFSVAQDSSGNSMLVYSSQDSRSAAQVVWMDRTGKPSAPAGARIVGYDPALSPDEKLVAVRRSTGVLSDLWLRDLSRGTETRLTSESALNESPVWSPKGDRIVYASNRRGAFQLYMKAVNGSGQDELLSEDSVVVIPTQWSRDGRFVVYYRPDPKSKSDIWVLPLEGSGERKPIPFLRSEFSESFGQISPDGHWMAFASDRSGRAEVYVRPFPAGEGEYTISIGGGNRPRWRGDGKELFFEGPDGKMMAAPVKATVGAKSFEAGAPTALFDAQLARSGAGRENEWDVTADGKRFLAHTRAGTDAAASPPLSVVTNWQTGLGR